MSRIDRQFIALGLVGISTIGAAVQRAAASVVTDHPSNWKMTFDDEFSGSSLDLTKWNYRYTGVRNDAVNTPDAVHIASAGALAITTYTTSGTNYTGMIGTQGLFAQKYGYFEASIDFNGSSGEWGAFWLQSPTNGQPIGDPGTAGTEIDVVENRFYDTNQKFIGSQWGGALHWDGYGTAAQSAGQYVPNLNLQSGNHTYGLLWTAQGYTFYVDNQVVWTTSAGISNTAEYLILSCEVHNNSWAGDIPTGGYGSASTSTTKMYVDYVHVYSEVPEPAGLGFVAIGMAGLVRRRRSYR